MTPYILVAEDEDPVIELLRYNLEREGYEVGVAKDGEEALVMMKERAPDLLLLDWMLPKVTGIEVCRQTRSRSETRNLPIIMVTARTEESDRIRGLDTGADDYIAKPFSTTELMARIRAVMRRIRPGLAEDVLSCAGVEINRSSHTVMRDGQELHLGPTEFRLLSTFMEKPGRVWSREQLLDRVWGRDIYVDTRTVDVHIGRLRKALTQHGGDDPVRTVRGAGYALG